MGSHSLASGAAEWKVQRTGCKEDYLKFCTVRHVLVSPAFTGLNQKRAVHQNFKKLEQRKCLYILRGKQSRRLTEHRDANHRDANHQLAGS